MCDFSEKICLVIPCYNEAKRLDFEKYRSVKSNCYFLFVNDGSTDNTLEILKNNLSKNMFLLDLDKNRGKAEAVRRGFLYTKALPIFDELEWVGFMDADLATPLRELNNFVSYSKFYDEKIDSVWGSRVRKLGSKIERTAVRHYLGRIYATAVHIVLGVKSYDSQCGAKLFRKESIDEFFSEPFVSKWSFDVEILLRMKDLKIIECPVHEWKDVPGGSLKIPSVALRTLYDIIKLRLKYF